MLSGHIFGEKIKSLGNTDMEYLTGFFLYIMNISQPRIVKK